MKPVVTSLRDRARAGFTLLELLVVMGILALFGVFLVRVLDLSVSLIGGGEISRELVDRGMVASEFLARDLNRLTGFGAGEITVDGTPRSRILCDAVRLGLRTDAAADWAPRLRATVALDRADEVALLRQLLARKVEETARNPQEREDLMARLLAMQSLTGVGEVGWIAWPARRDPEGAYLEVRRTLRPGVRSLVVSTTGETMPTTSLFDDKAWASPELVTALAPPVLEGILHVEFRWWSQFTTRDDGDPGRDGPESAWDSARAGQIDPTSGRRFALDLGPASLVQTLDDVFPHRVQAVVVVDRAPGEASCAILRTALDERAQELVVDYPERLPDPGDNDRFVKIGGEWIGFAAHDGLGRLTGLKRGARGTAPRAHAVGARVHAGRTVRLTVPLVGRDWWNG